jgi:hypothetical protein
MRTKVVTINDIQITIKEKKIRDLKERVLPKIEPALDSIMKSDTTRIIDTVGDQFNDFFPELSENGVDLEDCYLSDIEAFLEAWVEVNFSGLKRLFGQLLSLTKTGQRNAGSNSVSPLDSLITGAN